GKSFKAPALLELGRGLERFGTVLLRTTDPRTGMEVIVPWGRGGNPNLEPETSETISFGVEWRPQFLRGLLLSATHTSIDWTNRIQVLDGSSSAIWPLLDRLPDLIPRDIPVALGGDGDPDTIDLAVSRPANLAA